jgi:hypothetical protein
MPTSCLAAVCAQGSITPWRVLFTAGMLGGAVVAKSMTPDAFDFLPATFTVRPCLESGAPACVWGLRRSAAAVRPAHSCWMQLTGLHPE